MVSVADAHSWIQQPDQEEVPVQGGVTLSVPRKTKAAAEMCPKPQSPQSCIVNDGKRPMGLPQHMPVSNPAAHRIAQVLASRLNGRADPAGERPTVSSPPTFDGRTRGITQEDSESLQTSTSLPGQRMGPPSATSTLSNPDAGPELTDPKGLRNLSAMPLGELSTRPHHSQATCTSTHCPPQQAVIDSLGDSTCRVCCVATADALLPANEGPPPCERAPTTVLVNQDGSQSGVDVALPNGATSSLEAQQLEAYVYGDHPLEQASAGDYASSATAPQTHGSNPVVKEAWRGGGNDVLASPACNPMGPFQETAMLPQLEMFLTLSDPVQQISMLQQHEAGNTFASSHAPSSVSSSFSSSPKACPESGQGEALQPGIQPPVQKEPVSGEAESREAFLNHRYASADNESHNAQGGTESAAVGREAAGVSGHVAGDMWEKVARLEREVGELRGERSLMQGYVKVIAEEMRAWMGRVDSCFLSLEARLRGEEQRQAAVEALQLRIQNLEKSQPSLEVRSPSGLSTLPNPVRAVSRLCTLLLLPSALLLLHSMGNERALSSGWQAGHSGERRRATFLQGNSRGALM